MLPTTTAATMSSKEIAELTGKFHSNVIRDIRAMLEGMGDESDLNHVVAVKDSRGYTAEILLDRYHTEVLVTGYDVKRRAAVIKRWYELETQQVKPIHDNTAATMALVQCAAALLNASESGKIIMLQKAGKAIGADTSFLPDYVEDSAPGHVGSMDTAAATALLTEFDTGITARAFNKLAESHGLIEKRMRNTSRGESWFWCVTKSANHLGKNITSPQNPRETQPHWYRDMFGETLRVLGIK